MSLHVPGVPKNACHIHKSYDATASKIIVGLPLIPAYCPAQAVGQFFHSQCIQSILPTIPGNPRSAPTWSSLAKSPLFGLLSYS
ncbi:hypothetical protein Hanom_Chr08g00733951 [Helianthus anomalus]